MSAYGKVALPQRSADAAPIHARVYPLPEKVRVQPDEPRQALLCVPFGASSSSGSGNGGVGLPEGAKKVMAEVFNAELQRGLTYPQRGPMTLEEFEGYFLAYDVIVGVFLSALPSSCPDASALPPHGTDLPLTDVFASPRETLHSPDFDWTRSLACFYYVKPNYPGRSSHLCNAGFVVPPRNRQLGLGSIAGRSFLHFAPALGYKGSVFNLVYENNLASLAIWQRLGFTQVGKIPAAGLLRTSADSDEEAYFDAWVIHCDFEERRKKEEALKKAEGDEVEMANGN